MILKERIECLIELGRRLSDANYIDPSIYAKAKIDNPWFTEDSIRQSIHAISANYLASENLNRWLENYDLTDTIQVKVGMILAGNIPLVGFHDFLCTFLSGHHALIKTSSKDKILFEFILSTLEEIDSSTKEYYSLVDRMVGYDAVIATGSDESKAMFKEYFAHVPHILRGHRNAIAVIDENTSEEQLQLLGNDIFDHFGLGCRNVSKLYLKKGIELGKLFESWNSYASIVNHNKYKNNYDYNYALYLMNKVEFFTNNFIILKPDVSFHSRIASVHYEYFSDRSALASELKQHKDKIQCVVSDKPLNGLDVIGFGEAQSPLLSDYADGVDTMKFITAL